MMAEHVKGLFLIGINFYREFEIALRGGRDCGIK